MRNSKAWLMWGLLLPTYALVFFHRTSLSTIGDELAAAWGLREGVGAALGSLAGVYFVIYAVLQIPSGLVADTVGARVTVSVSSALMGAGAILFATTDSFGIAMLARFLVGFGAAFNFIALLRQQVNWFDQKYFPLLTSLTVVTGNIGALFGVGPFAFLSSRFGWQKAYLGTSCVTLVFAAIIAVFVRNGTHARASHTFSTLSAGLLAVVRNRTNYLTFIAFGLSSGVYLTFAGFWGVPFLQHVHGLSPSEASTCTTVMLFGVVLGCPVTSWAVARIADGPRRVFLIAMGVAALLWAAILFAPLPVSVPGLVIAEFLFLGFFVSSFILAYATVRECNPTEVMGTALAFTNTGGFVAVAGLQVLVGVILDRFVTTGAAEGMPVYPREAYTAAFAVLFALHLLSMCAYWLAPKRPVPQLRG